MVGSYCGKLYTAARPNFILQLWYIFPISKKISAFAKFCVEKWVEVSFLFPYREDFGDEVMDQRF